ncbi:hypothetical protein CYY_008775 [Polysphondylium violaceum]|uniref:Purinergic receptor n=1 Tax=Polysphondylium violaceum TaxID=133409 RepID=A0A8J4PPW5_9MYCE|nr:hypothetical protein CYY_008775 [Polysphondylium violaceum]
MDTQSKVFFLDFFYSYNTKKMVKIRDKRLSFLHLFFVGSIILYVLIGPFLVQQKYLEREIPVGSIRLSLLIPPEREQYLPYCLNETNTMYSGYLNKPCVYWDETLMMYPLSEENSLFITTRVTIKTQEVNNCSLTQRNCTHNTLETSEYYIADVDKSTILIDHTMVSPKLGIQYNANELSGILLDQDDKLIEDIESPNVVGVVGEYDILTLEMILKAAGIDTLDQEGFENSSRSIRDDGMLLFCFITYSNTYTYNTNMFRYTLRFHLIQDSKFKILEPIYLDGVNKRQILNRHGVRIIFIQNGRLGQFDFQTTLLTFISGMGLATFAGWIVDFIAIRLIQEREKYAKMKYQDSDKT